MRPIIQVQIYCFILIWGETPRTGLVYTGLHQTVYFNLTGHRQWQAPSDFLPDNEDIHVDNEVYHPSLANSYGDV